MKAKWVILFGFVFDKALGQRPGGQGKRDQKGGYEMSHVPNLRRAGLKFNNTPRRKAFSKRIFDNQALILPDFEGGGQGRSIGADL